MLQNLRDNLKGTVAIVVIIIFVVPLVLFGVEQLFVGSVGGSGAASVNGEDINQKDVQRELILEKQRRQQRFKLEANSPQLEDAVLVGPVLKRMTRRLALSQAAEEGGMGASKDVLWAQIGKIEAFQIDGKLDYDLFKERISYLYTTSSFLEASASDLILGHVNTGISNSAFITDKEVEMLAAITQQKRTFFSVTVPKASVSDVGVTDDEVSAHYDENPSNFMSAEKVVVEYIELSLAELAKLTSVPAEDVQAAYEAEVSGFVADPKYTVAHILLKNADGREAKVKELSAKLAANEDFSELAKQYSEDLGSKDSGGSLGEMVADAYPSSFVEAAKALAVGAVSEAVETDSGLHFIKLLEKTNTEAPSFDERKASLTRQLSRDLALEVFAQKIETLGDATFGSDSLTEAAEALSLEVKVSESFGRKGGVGVSADSAVASAAYADDVLLEGHNSRVLELAGDRAVVLRLKSHEPEAVKPLALVKLEIRDKLVGDKKSKLLTEKASVLKDKLVAGGSAETLAKELSYEYKLNEKALRTSFDLGGSIVRKVFSLARPLNSSAPVLDLVQTQDGSHAVVGLLSVEDGLLSEMESEQVDALKGQLSYQLGQLEMSAFENAIVNRSDIIVPE